MSQQHILQISELTKKVRFILESELNTVWLTGEVSNFIAASSGHWYLSLKDAKSQVKCAMFKGSNRRVRLGTGAKPSNGQQVLVRAKVSLYEPRGDFQLIIEHMEDAGAGMLRQQFEQLKNKLNAQGLFDLSHKKQIPKHINCVGIVTSPTGAAVKDILTVLKRRNANVKAIIYPALVQGEYAQGDICHAIERANSRQECDVLIVGRGGGSLEDLWPFNEESVVRAIYQSELPVISAVGHEIDTTLSDYVADLRAATPSAAAELVSSDSSELLNRVVMLKQRLLKAQQVKLAHLGNERNYLQHRLSQVHPEQQLQLQQQKADELGLRLKQVMKRIIVQSQTRPAQLNQRLLQQSPVKVVQFQQQKVSQNEYRITQAMQNTLQHKSELFVHLLEQLQLVSPLATIARGYSVTRDTSNKVVTKVAQVDKGEEISVQLSDGHINAKVV
ncbi:exodeoxyribonuclease VII large subunit [Colwellia psychrerythraea]|uniref:Exodeoxyribonuclease 7 large subunit n=1 Tax=Colwellia psychrerythraea TaxID=28229 RepID=A0A099KL43_COLPS|nr:exodeoxyribonuclease VII large subunit [Colwellia psychrerythraea]KGJ90642.1 Exodeoxyribonuclease 7 large subunit [Colwellia psychrerythraea]